MSQRNELSGESETFFKSGKFNPDASGLRGLSKGDRTTGQVDRMAKWKTGRKLFTRAKSEV